MKSLDKKKTKELEWDRFVKENHTNFSKDANGIKYEFYEDDLLEFITQQRTEIEQQKVKVVWNDVCEQIKQEARTELLEEINKEIDYSEAHHEVVLENWGEESRDVFKSKSEVKGFLMALEAFRELITNLLNKKDE